jgi:hypothetical protein
MYTLGEFFLIQLHGQIYEYVTILSFLFVQHMIFQEKVSEELYNGFFVDLFVRASNNLAIMMYTNLGYVIYRQVLGYYSGALNTEDAYGKIYLWFEIEI